MKKVFVLTVQSGIGLNILAVRASNMLKLTSLTFNMLLSLTVFSLKMQFMLSAKKSISSTMLIHHAFY